MNTNQAIEKIGSVRKLALLLGISTSAVYAWKGVIPELRVFQIEKALEKMKAKK